MIISTLHVHVFVHYLLFKRPFVRILTLHYIYFRCHYCFVFLHMHVLNQGGGAAGATCVLMCQYDVPAERAFQWALSLLTHIKPKR